MTVRTAILVLILAGSVVWAQSAPTGTINSVQNQVNGSASTTPQNRQNVVKQTAASSGKQQSTAAAAHASTNSVPKPMTSKSQKPAAQNSAVKQASEKTANGEKKKLQKSVAAQPKTTPKKAVEAPKPASEQPAEKDEKAQSAEPETESETAEREVTATMRGRRDPFLTVIRPEAENHCTVGKKCLVVGKMDLKGIVRSQNGMIAVVENQQRKTFFLHENDPVFNGHVVKINPDSVLFRETVTDRVGRQSTRDIVKRIITGPSA